MRVNDDFLGSSQGRRIHYDINGTIDDIDDQDLPEEAPPVKSNIQKASPKTDGSDEEYEIDDSYDLSDEDQQNFERPKSPRSTQSDSESGLSELSNEQNYFQNKMIYQKRALFYKSLTIHSRNKFSILAQICFPCVGLLLLMLIGSIGKDNIQSFMDGPIFFPFPYIFGMNYKPLSSGVGYQGIVITNCDRWFYTDFAKNATQRTKEFWGSNTGEHWSNTTNAGMIDGSKNIMSSPCSQIEKTTPYFKDWQSENQNQHYNKYDSLDAFLYQKLENLAETKMNYVERNFDYNVDVRALPDAVYTVREANDKILSYDSRSNCHHLWQYHRNDGMSKIGFGEGKKASRVEVGRYDEGNMEAAHIINKAYIKHQFNTTVVSGINFYPYRIDFENEIFRTETCLSIALVPFCMLMGFPLCLFNIVNEKEKRLIEIMKINGLKMVNYWINTFVFNWLQQAIVFSLFCFISKFLHTVDALANTNIWINVLLFNGWIFAQISWACFVSVFVQKSLTASVIGYVVAVYLMVMSTLISMVFYVMPLQLPWYYHFIPTFSFVRGFNYVGRQCLLYGCYRGFDDIYDTEPKICILMLYVQTIVYGLLALYLYQIVPQNYGVTKKWNFLCKNSKRNIGKPGAGGLSYDFDEIGDLEEDRENNYTPVFDYDTQLEDSDCRAERNIVYNLDKADYFKYPLIIKDLRKEFEGIGGRKRKVATKNMSLRIKKGEMFGLLGPNGAGKTTLISMLTGLFEPTRGNVWVAGFDIRHQIEAVHLQIGFCPQFDILWPNLTIREHLLFYARLKGISPLNEDEMVDKAIDDVLLKPKAHEMVKSLSGGMKRRLSVAISLVSDPKIIYLDEPSTGLDPESRRQMWDILAKCRGKRAIMLTTHSMEEADVLCNRIAIINQGIMRCVAPQTRLKTLYGSGYHLQINCVKQRYLNIQKKIVHHQKKRGAKNKKKEQIIQKSNQIRSHPSNDSQNSDDEQTVQTDSSTDNQEKGITIQQIHQHVQVFVVQLIPQAELISEFNGNFVYLIPQSKIHGFNPSQVFTQFEANKKRLYISDWGLSQSSLDDVFTKICEQNGDNNA